MLREYESFLRDMLDRAEWILRCTADKCETDLREDLMLQDTVIRSMEIIGEAAKRVPPEYRLEHPAVDWQGFARFRDVIVHRYFKLNLQVIWLAVQEDVPKLARQLAEIVRGDEG